jgi:hypothetical protein
LFFPLLRNSRSTIRRLEGHSDQGGCNKKRNSFDVLDARFRYVESNRPWMGLIDHMDEQPRLYLRSSRVVPTQEQLDHLAGRIERAYGLRQPGWWRGGSTTRVWFAAAVRLWEAHAEDSLAFPLDPELFVAAQPISGPFSDPWSELAEPAAARRYRTLLRRIVRKLRAELRREVRFAERLIERGREIKTVLSADNGRLSPLGCFIVACRAGRADLAARFAALATAQHRSCTLYQLASLSFLPADSYPAHQLGCAPETEPAPRGEKLLLSLN